MSSPHEDAKVPQQMDYIMLNVDMKKLVVGARIFYKDTEAVEGAEPYTWRPGTVMQKSIDYIIVQYRNGSQTLMSANVFWHDVKQRIRLSYDAQEEKADGPSTKQDGVSERDKRDLIVGARVDYKDTVDVPRVNYEKSEYVPEQNTCVWRHGTVTQRSKSGIQVSYSNSSLLIQKKWLTWEQVRQLVRLAYEAPQVGRTMRRHVDFRDEYGDLCPAVVVKDTETGVTVEYTSRHSKQIQRRFVARKDIPGMLFLPRPYHV